MKKKISNNILNSLKLIYVKLFKIHDTPQKIALGLGLGVFLGIFPGSGPIAALFLAYLFRVNRASALIGSLLTNTWLSIVIFLLSIKFGLSITQFKWQKITHNWLESLRIIFPILLSYLLIGLILGVAAYLISLSIIIKLRKSFRP